LFVAAHVAGFRLALEQPVIDKRRRLFAADRDPDVSADRCNFMTVWRIGKE